MEFIRSSDFKI